MNITIFKRMLKLLCFGGECSAEIQPNSSDVNKQTGRLSATSQSDQTERFQGNGGVKPSDLKHFRTCNFPDCEEIFKMFLPEMVSLQLLFLQAKTFLSPPLWFSLQLRFLSWKEYLDRVPASHSSVAGLVHLLPQPEQQDQRQVILSLKENPQEPTSKHLGEFISYSNLCLTFRFEVI